MSIPISSQILDELLSAVEVIGVSETIKKLREAKSNSLLLSDLNIDFILTSVSELTGVTKDRILNGSDRNDERKLALALSVYFIKNEFYYSYAEIKKIFNKDESALSRYNALIERNPTTPKTELEKKISELFKKINLLIIEKKLKK
jgi:hypothetical protein